MEIFPLIQAKLLCLAVLCGAVGGILRDLIWGVESMLKSKKGIRWTLCFFGDLISVMSVCFTVVLLSYYFNDGEPRGFALLGVLVGFFVYKSTLSTVIKSMCVRILAAGAHFALKIFGPIVNILKILLQFIKKSRDYLCKAIEKNINMVYNIFVKKYVLRSARSGLLGRWKK